MPIPASSTVLFQKRIGGKLVLFVKDKNGKVTKDVRTSCKCSKDPKKPCKCKK